MTRGRGENAFGFMWIALLISVLTAGILYPGQPYAKPPGAQESALPPRVSVPGGNRCVQSGREPLERSPRLTHLRAPLFQQQEGAREEEQR